MKKLLALCFCICTFQFAAAQDWTELSRLKKQFAMSRPDTGRINIFLRMAEFETFKPGEYKIDLDSAASYINEAEQLNSKLRSPEMAAYITIEKSYLAKDHEDRKAGQALMQNAFQQLSGTRNWYLLGTACLGLSEYYDYTNPKENQLKIKYIQQAADFYRRGKLIEREAYCDKCLAEILPDDELCFKKTKEAIALYKSINYKKLQGVYDLLAQFYADKNDLKKALENDLEALRIANEQHDTSGTLVEIEYDLSTIYDKVKDYDNEFKYLHMAFTNAKLNGDLNTAVFITVNLVNNYHYINNLSKAKKALRMVSESDLAKVKVSYQNLYYTASLSLYTSLREFDIAEPVSLKLISILDNKLLFPAEKVAGYQMLVSYYLDRKQIANVDKYILIDKRVLRNLKIPDQKNSMLQALLYRRDTLLHNYKAAVLRLQDIYRRADSLNNDKYLLTIRSMQIQYGTKEKESQLLFFKQKASLESQNYHQAKVVKDYTLGGIILLLVIAGLLYRQNRLKQRNNRIISTKNQLLENLVSEKEWLLKEVHHRVKNNLHTVICLLESQAAYLENDALKAIENSQHRIYAMSLIHQKLYQSEDVKTIDMDVYLKEFIQYLDDSFGNPENIKIQFGIEPIKLGVAQAIPVGLIINEAVTNCYKYAFPGNTQGKIKITLHQSENLIELVISDDGIGMVVADNFDDTGSLGMELIKGLSRDLRGQLKLDGKKGTSIRILFEDNVFEKAMSNQTLPVLT